jgi:hypothetical protein
MQPDGPEKEATNEAAYRRGWKPGFNEAERIILQLGELGYSHRKIRQLLAVYNDHCVSEWRNHGDLENREPFLYLDKVIDRRISLSTQILPSFLQVLPVS